MPMTIRKEIEIDASIEQVWNYVGTEVGLRQWWGIDICMEEKEGGRCQERSIVRGKRCYLSGIVTTYEPPRQLTLLMQADSPDRQWPEQTTISLTLSEENGYTRVKLIHQASASSSIYPWPKQSTEPTQIPIAAQPVILNQLNPNPALYRGNFDSGYHASMAPTGQVYLTSIWEQEWSRRFDILKAQIQE